MTEQEAIGIARAVAQRNEWPWLAPEQARRFRPWLFGAPCWEIRTNAQKMGMNVRVVLDERSGRVLEKGFIPR